jgi:nucleotide-binding universal stress UspA family protein
MSYNTILVHLNNEHRSARLIDVAIKIAEPAAAHLTGLFVVPHIPYTSRLFPRISTAVAQGQLEAYCKMSEGIQKDFEWATVNLLNGADWRLYEPEQPSYVDAVLDCTRCVDLVIAAQKESDWDYSDMFDVPEWIALGSGRPVLLVPQAGCLETVGERVVVAWNNSRESARAVFDALPLLARAKYVQILCIDEADKLNNAPPATAPQIIAALSRHGIAAEAGQLKPKKNYGVGETLLSHVSSTRCDLLVMGCYGRSRLREFVLGGASRHVLHHATVPVLLAH